MQIKLLTPGDALTEACVRAGNTLDKYPIEIQSALKFLAGYFSNIPSFARQGAPTILDLCIEQAHVGDPCLQAYIQRLKPVFEVLSGLAVCTAACDWDMARESVFSWVQRIDQVDVHVLPCDLRPSHIRFVPDVVAIKTMFTGLIGVPAPACAQNLFGLLKGSTSPSGKVTNGNRRADDITALVGR